ncbi:hypothetical protein EJ110_NYTH58999 [Nymphaea thermarum]|nr:hypothetical protein EJ110_NYTH58999 [Nymphaea thermarum]
MVTKKTIVTWKTLDSRDKKPRWRRSGKWMAQEEAFTLNNAPRSGCAGATCSKAKDGCERVASSAVKTLVTYSETEHSQSQGSPAPRPVLKSAACARSIKGVPSSIAVTKRKRDEKPKAVSEEEAAALKARDAARKRTNLFFL